MAVDKIIHRSSGIVLYYRLMRLKDGFFWNNITSSFETAPSWGDSAITISEESSIGKYPIDLPSDLPNNSYDLLIYIRAGATPVNTDVFDSGYELNSGRSIFGF